MVQKPVVRNWHREQYAAGKGSREGIPPEALAILDAEHGTKVVEEKAVEPKRLSKFNEPKAVEDKAAD